MKRLQKVKQKAESMLAHDEPLTEMNKREIQKMYDDAKNSENKKFKKSNEI